VSAAHHLDTKMILAAENVSLPENAGRGLSMGLLGLGSALVAGSFMVAVTGDSTQARVAMFSFHIGFLVSLGFALGSLGFVMILHQVNAGWSATVRRQFENMMSLLWVAGVFFVLEVVMQLMLNGSRHVYLYGWMDLEHVGGDPLYQHKQAFLNAPFFYARAVIYFAVWLGLSRALWSYSTRQDSEGDKWLTARARRLSAVGLPLFALTTAFAGFDWIMSLDYHWFSTMLGVYFFSGNMVACLALGTLVLIALRSFGRLHGAFTEEHLHDLAKLVFAFMVFWSYISFSQYFLIWYANIPEETAWIVRRKSGPWEAWSWVIPIGHFIVPFIFLMARTIRRRRGLVALGCVWMLGMHAIDLMWAVRPEVTDGSGLVGPRWMDVVGIAGPVCLFLGVLVRKIASGPLMPLRDPRLKEALTHKNYV